MHPLRIHNQTHGVKENLEKQISALIDYGGWMNPKLCIEEMNGYLCLKTDSLQSERQNYLRVPVETMPRLDDYIFGIEGTHLTFTPNNQDRNACRDYLLEQMVELYNLTSKPQQWGRDFPFLALADQPHILHRLCSTRVNVPKIKHYHQLLQSGDTNTLSVDSFLGSRCFHLISSAAHSENSQTPHKLQHVLMPIADLMNHHPFAQSYHINYEQHPVSLRVFSRPDPVSGELYVRYNQYDALDTLLVYGFVDLNAPWLKSIPLTLDLGSDHTIRVEALGGVFKGDLPPALRDLRFFMPQRIDPDSMETGVKTSQPAPNLTVNRLLIPGPKAPRALQRVLAFLIKTLQTRATADQINKQVTRCEKQIIENNEAYWRGLLNQIDQLDDRPVKAQLQMLCRHSLRHIQSYSPVSI